MINFLLVQNVGNRVKRGVKNSTRTALYVVNAPLLGVVVRLQSRYCCTGKGGVKSVDWYL